MREILARIDCREEKMRENCNNNPAIAIVNPLAKEKHRLSGLHISLSLCNAREK